MNKRQNWPLGPGVVSMGDGDWGHDQGTFSPPEYGDYLATSNGVYACATLRARLLSSLPLLPYRLQTSKAKTGKEAVSGGPLLDLLTKVNPHWCVDDQTEALTMRGWLRGEDVTTDDRILSMRVSDGQLTWSAVRSVFRQAYDGEMIPIHTRQVDALVTPGHKFATIDGQLIPVEELRQGHCIRTMGTAACAEGTISYADAFVSLVGWFVTEGHVCRTKHRTGRRGERPTYGTYRDKATTVDIAQKDGTSRCDQIRATLVAAGARWHEYVSGVVRRFEVTGPTAAALQEAAPDKVMTLPFMASITPEQRILLLDTLIDGDGSRHPSASTVYFVQRRRDIVDAFVALCALAGKATHLRLRTFGQDDGHFGGPVWVVSVLTRKTNWIRKHISERESYTGLIWCPETEYGTFVCRRNGAVYVTGNTMARLLQQTELSLCMWGQAHWFLERGAGGRLPPREIWWGRPDRVRPLTDASKYITGYDYYPANAGSPITFSAGEVIWFRYPNPLDEFSGLSPMAAARLAADYGSAAMKANKALFEHGLHMGGMISLADKSQVMTNQQREEIETLIDKRYRGADNAHRWMVLRGALEVQGLSITPKDADYLGGLKQSLEDICRAFGVPQDLIQAGQHTYENVDAAMRAMWTQTMRPEARMIATELTEQLLPMFPGSGDVLEFDFAEVEELKEEETEAWTRWQQQIATGAVTINEWRADQGLDAVAWGDVFWASSILKPITDGEPEPPPSAPVIVETPPEEAKQLPAGEEPKQLTEGETQPAEEAASEEPRLVVAPQRRGLIYGSDEHRAVWQRFATRTESQEGKVAEVVAGLFRRQEASILAKLKASRGVRADPWDDVDFKARWRKEFRVAMRPVLRDIVEEAGQQGIASLGLGLGFNVVNPKVLRFIEQRAQRFATEVNATTWDDLRKSLSQGIEAGEDMDLLAKRVERVMGDRIASSASVVARTETIGAANGGTLQGWRQAQDLVGPLNKHWVCVAGDTRVSGLNVTFGARRLYSGPLVELTTTAGRVLTVTAKHLVLTRRGWVSAEDLKEGDDLVCQQFGIEGATPGAGGMPDIDDVPPKIAEAFDALYDLAAPLGAVHRVMDFDSEGRQSDIDVVPVDGELRHRLEPTYPEGIRQLALKCTDEYLGMLMTTRGVLAGGVTHALAAGGGACCSHSLGDNGGTLVASADESSLRLGSGLDASNTQTFNDTGAGAAPSAGKTQNGCALPVFLGYDRCLSIKVSSSVRHVYDYTTVTGWMIANSIIVHNCALDDRTRDSHIAAHEQYNGADDGIPLEDDFQVGGGRGPAPGQIGLPEEDIQCRCTMTAEPAPF